MRELRVEDALLYLDQVKVEFGDRPHIYNEFLDIMKTFKTQQIDTPGVIRRVSNLFQGNRKLVLGFNTFLPEGYKIELPLDGNGPPIAVFRAPGETITHVLSDPVAPTAATNGPSVGAASDANTQKPAAIGPPGQAPMPHAPPSLGPGQRPVQPPPPPAAPGVTGAYPPRPPPGMMHMQPGPRGQLGQPPQMMSATDAAARARLGHPAGPAIPGRGPPQLGRGMVGQAQPDIPGAPHHPGLMQQNLGMQHQPSPPGAAQPQREVGQPLEFDHAINYVTTIKKRFANEPETYKKFLEILHTYQKEQRGIKEVLEEVSVLFSEHPDLLKEFTYFLPDAVQAEAKAQLEIVAKEAEARKRAADARRKASGSIRPASMMTPQSMQGPSGSPTNAYGMQSQYINPNQITIPFGATQGRSLEREREIFRSAVYGSVSFAPGRPPRKNALSVSQAAAKNGRPSMLPALPIQPSTAETVFFEKAKLHLNRRELAPDKPSGARRHTPYTEFLKCLHLFGAGVLNKDELMLLLRGLFVQGHAPKSGANAGGGASNPGVASDAHDLLKELEQILVGRGPYARQESYIKDKSKYGSKRAKDYDFHDCERPTPSYVSYPLDYPTRLFMQHTGKNDQDVQVLNDEMVCVGPEDVPSSGSLEDYNAVKVRKNAYEEAMFRIEDERFEVDMAIERNALAMRQIEPIAEEVELLRQNEEKDGQPIGRLQYKLNSRTLNSIQINAIGRIYGDSGDEVIEHLGRNPLAVLPIVYQRLRQKDQEWRKQKSELLAKWKAGCEANYEGSMDFLCYFKKQEVERGFSAEQFRDECQNVRSYCSDLDKQAASTANFGLSLLDRSAVLYEPYAVVEMKPDSSVHHTAVRLLLQQVVLKLDGAEKGKLEREMVGRIWMEFMVPFFGYPVQWVQDEARESFGGKLNNVVVQYAVGQHVKTAFGDGTILAFLPGNETQGPQYRVRLPFGIAFLNPSSIAHGLQQEGVKYVRREGQMVKESTSAQADETIATLDKKFKLLFGSNSIYCFMRLYSALISLLDEIETYLRVNPAMSSPAESYYNPMKSQDEKKEPKLDFSSMISSLQKVVSKKLTSKDFESFCRLLSTEMVHKMAALPKLVADCADMLVHMAKEDLLLPLLDVCQTPGSDPVQVRAACLSISPDVSYRIQFNTTNGRLYFSYLPKGQELSTVPIEDDDDDDDDEAMEDNDLDSDDDDDDDDVMDVEDEEEDLRQVKRQKI